MNSTQNTIAAAAMISSSPAALSMVAVIALRMTRAMMVPAATPAPPNSAWPACGEPCDCNGGNAGGFGLASSMMLLWASTSPHFCATSASFSPVSLTLSTPSPRFFSAYPRACSYSPDRASDAMMPKATASSVQRSFTNWCACSIWISGSPRNSLADW